MTGQDPIIPWRSRRTARWMSLSLAARGAVEGIVVAMGGRREMQLGPLGLESLAGVLGRPWSEVRPAVSEALSIGKLEFDAARNVLVDPSRDIESAASELAEIRRQLEAARAQLAEVRRVEVAMPDGGVRQLSQGKDAVRARIWRAKKRAQAAASTAIVAAVGGCDAQLELYPVRPAFARTFANGDVTNVHAADVVAAPESGVIPTHDDSRTQAFASRSRTDASLSGSSISSNDQREARRTTSVRLTAGTSMPDGWLERARELRPDLPAENVTKSWGRFAAMKAKSFPSWQAVAKAWEGWIEHERVSRYEPPPAASTGRAAAVATAAPYHRPTKLPLPDQEPETPRQLAKAAPNTPALPSRESLVRGFQQLSAAVGAIA